MELDWSCRCEQHAFCVLANLPEERHQLIGLGSLVDFIVAGIHFWQIASSGSMRLINDDATIAPAQKLIERFLRSTHDQSLRNQANLARAFAERLGSIRWISKIVFIDPCTVRSIEPTVAAATPSVHPATAAEVISARARG